MRRVLRQHKAYVFSRSVRTVNPICSFTGERLGHEPPHGTTRTFGDVRFAPLSGT